MGILRARLGAVLFENPEADWPSEVLSVQLQYNTTPTRTLRAMTPYEAFFGQPSLLQPTASVQPGLAYVDACGYDSGGDPVDRCREVSSFGC